MYPERSETKNNRTWKKKQWILAAIWPGHGSPYIRVERSHMVYAVSAELPLYIRRADCNVPLSFHPGSRHGKRDFILLVTFRIYADFSRMKACLYQPFIILHVKMPIPIRSGQQSVAQNSTIHTRNYKFNNNLYLLLLVGKQ